MGLLSGGLAIAIVAIVFALLFVLLAALLPSAWMRRRAAARTLESLEELPGSGRIVVLGCPTLTRSGEPNRYFVARIATAAAAYHHLEARGGNEAPAKPGILCSGWDARGEAADMAAALVAARVGREVIAVDGLAARTIDTIDHVATRFPGERIVFVSQRFHLPRVLFLARAHGLDAWALPAEGRLRGVRARIREALAAHRAILESPRPSRRASST